MLDEVTVIVGCRGFDQPPHGRFPRLVLIAVALRELRLRRMVVDPVRKGGSMPTSSNDTKVTKEAQAARVKAHVRAVLSRLKSGPQKPERRAA